MLVVTVEFPGNSSSNNVVEDGLLSMASGHTGAFKTSRDRIVASAIWVTSFLFTQIRILRAALLSHRAPIRILAHPWY
jgi:hypothetical protein